MTVNIKSSPSKQKRGLLFLAIHKAGEDKFQKSIHKELKKQKRIVLENFDTLTAGKTATLSTNDLPKLLPVGDIDKSMTEVAQLQVANAYAQGVEFARMELLGKQLDFDFEGIPDDMLEAIKQTVESIFGQKYWKRIVNDHSRDMIQSLLMKSIKEGLGAVEMARLIREDSAGTFSEERALRIARTETTAGLNGGSRIQHDQMMADGIIDGLEWLATADEKTRTTHVIVNGQQIKPGGMFTVGRERARYPGDPKLSAKERVYCRCTTLSVIE